MNNWTADRLCWAMSPKHQRCSWFHQNLVVLSEPDGQLFKTPFRSNGDLPIYGFEGFTTAAFVIEQQLHDDVFALRYRV